MIAQQSKKQLSDYTIGELKSKLARAETLASNGAFKVFTAEGHVPGKSTREIARLKAAIAAKEQEIALQPKKKKAA